MDITVNQRNQNPTGMLDQGEQKEKNPVFHILCWIFQLGIWITVTLSIVLTVQEKVPQPGLYVVTGMAYLFYVIIELSSPTSKYLLNKRNDQVMYENMGNIFSTLRK